MDSEIFGDLLYPFWFVNTPLLADLLRAEVKTAAQLLADHPNMRTVFDAPDAELSQREKCFELLAHRKLIEELGQSIVARHETPPSLNDMESRTLDQTLNLVPDDAPEWAREMQRVVDQLPLRVVSALPEPLRTEGYFPGNKERHATVRSAATPLSNVKQIQALTEQVIGQQWLRLAARWPSQSPRIPSVDPTLQPKQKRKRKRDKQRMARDKQIAEIDDVAETPTEFVHIMDERKVKPLPFWSDWPGSWVQAYRNRRLRKLIYQDKSRSLARFHGQDKK